MTPRQQAWIALHPRAIWDDLVALLGSESDDSLVCCPNPPWELR